MVVKYFCLSQGIFLWMLRFFCILSGGSFCRPLDERTALRYD